MAQSKLCGFRQRIAAGEDFESIARMHSECPSGARAGGMLGWISRATTLPAFDEALFALGEGEMSDVVETPLGFHILQQLGHEDARTADFEEVREQILDLIRHSRRGKAIADYVSQLRKQAVIEDDGEDVLLEELDWEDEGEGSQAGEGRGKEA